MEKCWILWNFWRYLKNFEKILETNKEILRKFLRDFEEYLLLQIYGKLLSKFFFFESSNEILKLCRNVKIRYG